MHTLTGYFWGTFVSQATAKINKHLFDLIGVFDSCHPIIPTKSHFHFRASCSFKDLSKNTLKMRRGAHDFDLHTNNTAIEI